MSLNGFFRSDGTLISQRGFPAAPSELHSYRRLIVAGAFVTNLQWWLTIQPLFARSNPFLLMPDVRHTLNANLQTMYPFGFKPFSIQA
jgi:hypothetical protein